MFYNKIKSKPATIFDLRQEHTNVSIPDTGPSDDWLLTNGYAHLSAGDIPSQVPANKVVEFSNYARVDDLHYVTMYAVRDKTPQELNSLLHSQISAIESQQTPRRLREAALGVQDSIDFLQSLDNQIAVLRSQML